MSKRRNVIFRMCLSALIAALYAVITIFTAPIAYGPVQFRIAEALNILPLFFPESILGLSIGCLIANFFSPGNVLLDTTLGTLATLISAISCYIIGKLIKKDILRIILGIIPAIIFNAILVPFTFLAVSELEEFYFMQVFSVGAGQFGVLVLLGIPLYFAIVSLDKKYHFFQISLKSNKVSNVSPKADE